MLVDLDYSFSLNVNVTSVSINYTQVSACALYFVKRFLMELTSEIQNLYIRVRDGYLKNTKMLSKLSILTLCVPCIILLCVNDQRNAQFL